MLKITNLNKNFGDKTAVSIPVFSIPSNQIVGIVGNNGAGKTTLFRLMLDLLKSDEGNIILNFDDNNINPSESEEWKDYVGAYIDESFLINFLTPEEYFDFIAKTNNIDTSTLKERLDIFDTFFGKEILDQHKLIRDFSAGNKQKIGIAGAMLHKPQLLILDEPFNFLDPSSQNHLKRLLKFYNENTGATILVSSHNLQHTIEISNRITVMEKGSIVKDISHINSETEEELQTYFS